VGTQTKRPQKALRFFGWEISRNNFIVQLIVGADLQVNHVNKEEIRPNIIRC
jgi:hypothetical protein